MSTVTRKGLEFIVNQIGKAKYVFKDLIGDTTYIRGNRLEFEKTLLRLKGSSVFNDYDLSKKDPDGIIKSNFTTFDTTENVGFAIQGGKIVIDSKISSFFNSGSWTPQNYSPPSTEGWYIYDYNAWSNYIPKYSSSGIANSNYVIYQFPAVTEPNSGSGRTTYEYPIRYNGSAYSRVQTFNSARWISFKNTSGSSKTEIRAIIPKTTFDGLLNVNSFNNKPLDLGIYSHRYLVSDNIDYTLTLDGTMGILGSSDVLSPLGFNVQESSSTGSTVAKIRDHWMFDINIPSLATWNNNLWIHLGFYWGSYDTYFKTGYPNYSAGTATSFDKNNLNSNWYIFNRKNFFVSDVNNFVTFEKTGVNDTNVYVYSNNKTNNTFIDQQYSNPNNSFRYLLNENITGLASTNSFLSDTLIDKDEFLPVIIASKNKGFQFDKPDLDLTVFLGSPIPTTEIPNIWSDFDYYPQINSDYDILFKIILGYPSAENSDINVDKLDGTYGSNSISIFYIEENAKNSFSPNINDGSVIEFFLPAEISFSSFIRNSEFDKLFDAFSLNVIPRILRYDIDKIKDLDSFTTNTANAYKSIHNLSKNPSDVLLQNNNDSEPKAIQFSKQGSNLIKIFTEEETSKNLAYINSNESYIIDELLYDNAEFEIYQQKDDTELNQNITGTKLARDYSLKIKFVNKDNTFYVKNLFVNASKYLLSDDEYLERQNKNLSMFGYYKKSTLTDIDDYRVYGYAAVVPDLESQSGRLISMKAISPSDSAKVTESDFETALLVSNPSYTVSQISNIKSGFALTSTFYTIDETKFDNKFVGIKDLGITISEYTLNTKPNWINNTLGLLGSINESFIAKPLHIKDLRSDSFLISGLGYTSTDNSINSIENIFDQALPVGVGSSISQQTHIGSKVIANNKFAIRINPFQNVDIKSLKIKLKKTSEYSNPDAKITVQVWSSKNNLPDSLLYSGSSTSLDSITNIFDEYEFFISYSFFKNKEYWIVLSTNNLPPVYDINTTGLLNINNNTVTGIYNQKNNSFTQFDKYNVGAKLGIGSTIPANIATWYEISSIGSSNSMTVSGAGITLNKQDYSIQYDFSIGIKESTAIGASTNFASYSSIGWSSDTGTAYINFIKPDNEIYAAFNRDFTDSNVNLPGPNKYRESLPNYYVDGYWSFDVKSFDYEQKLCLYPRSVSLKTESVIASGISGNNYISIGSTNFTPKILGGLGISQNSNISSGTAISYIVYDSTNEIYKINLNKNLIGSFVDNLIYVGTGQTIHLRRSQEIHVAARYYVNGGLASTALVLPKSSTWITYWNKQNRYNYSVIDKNSKPDFVTASYNLNLENYQIPNQIKYVNGYSVGDFVPKSSIGTTFDFKFTSSYGLKVFFDDSSQPSIDQWKNTSGAGYTCSYNINSISSPIKVEVQFYNLSSGIGQTLKAEWRVQGSSTWQDLDDSFYTDYVPEVVKLDDNNIQKISYVAVGNTSSSISAPYYGAPQNDMLTIRSK